ncbi:amidohydrolase family protein [Bryobacter aggregatus]|uniref:amidohydrolase family protein n=1 Tax=Bryobacter aggregatus TaxID=360054 RepID=UPI0004E2602D|nr:amidohydrolase family protein [Bryobacter aggregatus]
MQRRSFLAAAAAGLAPAATPVPIIDTHIHLFDPRRPQGVPWPPKEDRVKYQPALPERYVGLSKKHNVVGAIEVECSPWFDDNQWVLDIEAPAPIMVGMIGNLNPADSKFRSHLDTFTKNPLYLGIRYGNLWGTDLGTELKKPEFVAGLKDFASRKLILDSANPTLQLLADLRRASDLVPNLRMMIDHLPGMEVPDTAEAKSKRLELLKDLSGRRQIYVKGSAVLKKIKGATNTDSKSYYPKLDELWHFFGEDRVVFGSDWPNSDGVGTYDQVIKVVQDYLANKPQLVAEKYFWRNSQAAYAWKPRTQTQRQLA